MTNEQPDAAHSTRMLAKTMAAALAASRAEGSGVFGELAARLGEILEVDAAMIARYDPSDPRRAFALAAWLDGRLLQPFEYDMEGTPCRAMLDRESRFVASGVRAEFTPGTLFHAQGFDSYAAHSIVDAQGRRSGLIVAMHRRPMTAPAATEAVLRIFAVRAAAELERERAGRELRQSEASYRAIFEASEDAIFVHDWDTGAILDVSPKAADLYGYSREALRHLRVGDISANVPPYTEVEAMRHIQGARDSVAPVRFEWRARHRDGRLMWNEVTLKRAEIAGEPRVLAFVRDITDRKAADEALRLREEQYRAIFNASADALMLWNSRLQRVDVNPAHQKIFGFEREEVVGRAFEGLPYAEEYARPRIEMIRRALAGETIHTELEAIRKDGRRIITEMRTVPFSHRGEPHVLQSARDVTESRTADARLRASEEQYRAIFNASADALVLWDSQYRRVDVNLAYQKMYGWERDEVIGCGYEHPRFSPEYARPRLELVRRALAGESCHAELEAVRRDGTRVLTEVHAIPFRHRGEPHVLAIARDITERKRAEEALRAGEQQYRAIFDASADALVLRDADFRIVDVNATYEAMSGFPRDMVLGVDRVIANPPEVAAEIRALHARALAGEPIHFDTILLRRDDARYELELRGVPIQHRGAPHVLYIGRDVTARKQAENKRRELESQLLQAQKMEAIGQLTGGIAHDFNNILTSVMGYMALAAERPATEADPKLHVYLEQAQQSCHRARDLIQQMLAFSRGRRGAPRPVALGPLVNESTRMLQATLPSTLDLVASVEDAPTALVDPVQVHQILLNLCINARDAMNETGRITMKAAKVNVTSATCTSCHRSFSGAFAELAVIDSGNGIPPEVAERMFEPFFTTKDIGRGTGMGLSIVHGVVHEHAGHVLVESGRTEGTTFRVLLPLASGAAAPVAAELQPRGATRAPLRGRVLLVEDEHSVLGFMRELLQGWGLTVIAAGDPTDALRWFTLEPDDFDLVLTDQTMPGMTGTELARRLVGQRADLPVLMYSGRRELLNSEALSAAGVRRVLPKPVDREALREALQQLLPQSRQADTTVDPGLAGP